MKYCKFELNFFNLKLGVIVKYLSLIPKKWILSINLCWAQGTLPEFLRGHLSSFIDFIPGAILSHLVNLYGAFTKGLRYIFSLDIMVIALPKLESFLAVLNICFYKMLRFNNLLFLMSDKKKLKSLK